MKYLLVILLAINPITDLDKIAKVNDLKKKAKTAYTEGNYEEAINHYTYLLDSIKVEDDNITLNLANAYYQLKDSANAVNNYESLLDSKDRIVKSVSHQQLGIMANRAKKFEEALDHFKNAIRSNPKNDEARYNYEMLKKMLDEQKKNEEQNKDQNQDQKKDDQKKDQQNQDKENQDQQNKDQQQQNEQQDKEGQEKEDQNKEGQEQEQKDKQQQQQKEGEEGEEEKKEQPKPQEGEESDEKKGDQEQMESLSEKLKEMKISEEKAKMILEALKNNEIQYIQQDVKKATKRKDPNKPDW
ncbi:tetratricopeptide repeat-containing protein [Fulvivirga sp. RKSG066]|uniref:tetratricopeptide repeat protein n=1 Tax=Fulvivirga aurantia TaxID=2529383 RepID=UPI0012BC12DD|nr:tetratricopeptide repeat protein [Fulvivirga aurantia]MTI20836.1 tetratricopeptide repeat-containing protein [Fulvivirga aurantia]